MSGYKINYMKQILFIISLIGLTLISCTKSNSCDPTPTSLNGKWRMVLVKDNITGSSSTKPTSIQGEVDISFASSSSTTGTFSGNTPSNYFDSNSYSVGPNQLLTISGLTITKAAETTWGSQFVNNISNSQEYHFKNCDKLYIKTTNKTLTFQKL
jgi:hypothetical protein